MPLGPRPEAPRERRSALRKSPLVSFRRFHRMWEKRAAGKRSTHETLTRSGLCRNGVSEYRLRTCW